MTVGSQTPPHWKVIFAFWLVYIFWGSTSLAIGISVEHVPPLLMTGMRYAIAGPLMMLFCAMRGHRMSIGWSDAWRLLVIAVLLLTAANTIQSWAEQVVPTGLTSLVLAVTPLWFLVLEMCLFPGKSSATPRSLAGLALGISGIVVLMWPQLRNTGEIGHRQLFGSIGLVISALIWALGSVLSKKWHLHIDALSAVSWEMTLAGIVNLPLALLLGQHHRAVWTVRGVSAILYLVVFGSWVGYTAYIYILEHAPMAKVATYSYVNPIVAVFLGWLVLNERITGYILAGSTIIICAVVLVTGAEPQAKKDSASVGEIGVVHAARSGKTGKAIQCDIA